MGRIVLCLASMTTMAVALAGCGFADSHAVLPDFMRTKVSETPLQPVPDVTQLVRAHLDSVFTAASAPRDVPVSPARHDLRGPGWSLRQSRVDIGHGQPLGIQIYRININEGLIFDRQRVEA